MPSADDVTDAYCRRQVSRLRLVLTDDAGRLVPSDCWAGIDISGMDLRGADLRGADLRGADLGGADLGDADLWGADLGGAKIHGELRLKAVLQIGLIDDWPVLVCSTDAGIRLRVGCHFFTLDDAEAYWRDKPDRRALHYLAAEGWKALVRLAGWE